MKHRKYYWPWQLEVQNMIRGFRKPNPRSEWADICCVPDKTGEERIMAFVWFGIIDGFKDDDQGVYMVGYIARSLEADHCHFGDAALRHALRIMQENQIKTGRDDTIGARIDPRNVQSINLFQRNGFIDAGVDPYEKHYHRFVRFGFDSID
ncbi:hypothetical protein [Bifidobacterium scaligerum]|uniref:N-acetyltransferase domain-containing protein n=1 Tax=Bifidobacterium scaligerum TaxID=2052656 RepID=A0A2M9HT95_9BIFI|nr:hypothetical protein [Bifidobacterium scaligerum]PJM80019.1 hypothetical protein CUU80_02485 [Bifidobacterium scaligerum]